MQNAVRKVQMFSLRFTFRLLLKPASHTYTTMTIHLFLLTAPSHLSPTYVGLHSSASRLLCSAWPALRFRRQHQVATVVTTTHFATPIHERKLV